MFAASHSSYGYSSAGKLMSLVAAAEIAAAIMLLAQPMPALSGPLVGAMLGILGGSVFVLCRVAIPNAVRAPLILLLIATLMSLAVHADLFGLGKVGDKVSDATARQGQIGPAADTSVTTSEDPAAGVRQGRAPVRLEASGSDSGWAQRINDAAARDFAPAGTGMATIRGYVSVESDAGGDRLRVNWSVDKGVDTISCGLLSVRVTKPEFALDQIARSFRTAMERSAETGGPHCN